MHLSTPLSEALNTKPEYLRALADMGLKTVEDLLLYFPRAHEDLSQFKKLVEVQDGETVSLRGRFFGLKRAPTRNRRIQLLRAVFLDDSGMEAEAVWFNQPHLVRTLPVDTDVIVGGKVQFQYGKYQLVNPDVETIKEAQVHVGALVPLYPQHEVITSKWLRGKVHPLLHLTREFEELLPAEVLSEEKLMGKAEAVREAHFPSSADALKRARDRLGYEELFLLQLNALKTKEEWRRSRKAGQGGIPMDVDLVKRFFATLPFAPTGAQKVAIFEVLKDMEKPFPMMRLLEGDVGSGKTVVAAMAVLASVQRGYQAVLMAPTEVLAHQHAASVSKLLKPFNVNVQLLTGSLSAKEKSAAQEGIKSGLVQVAVGTHALIQESVEFSRLGLAVVDEQHRFGVKQREVFIRHGSPHLLHMTATPIPRTLAIVAFGDQDLSVLNEMPPGRKPIETRIVPPEHRQTVYRFVETKLGQGQQAYVICPLIDESDALEEVKSVKAEYDALRKVFGGYKVGLLHGRMTGEEKEAVMRDFKDNRIHVLVSTSVIEVGIDVPNATMMLIEGAERFGLSQLHQFRGRVGRGSEKSYCLLFATTGTDLSLERLKAMTETTDGFKLAEIDLRLRGPGEVYGVRQSGLPDLKMANIGDSVLVSRVRKAAEYFIEKSRALI